MIMKNMHRFAILLFLSVVPAFLFSCSREEIPVYSGKNYLFFTYGDDRGVQKQDFNFAYDAPLVRSAQAKAHLSLWGMPGENAFEYSAGVVDSLTSGCEGTDFEISEGSFGAGLAEDVYYFTVKRNEELLKTDFTIRLVLKGSEYAEIEPFEYSVADIHVYDKVEEPSWWKLSIAGRLGPYSDIKYRVFIIYMNGKILENLDDYTGIEFDALIADFRSWWKEKWDDGEFVYYDDSGNPVYESISK